MPGAQPTFPKQGPWNIKLPCGKCIGCRLDRSKQWAIRLMHEAQLHEKNSFITLTYNDDELLRRRTGWEPTVPSPLPSERSRAKEQDSRAQTETPAHADSLTKRDTTLFLKRLRKEQEARGFSKIRYYLVGEYGDKSGRPHYHAALFGEDFSDDRYEWRTTGANKLYRSSRLERLWPHGNAEIGQLTFESAAYVARYIMKKINGPMALEHYKRTDHNGSNYWLTPEFNVMSRRPGIGKEWIDKYGTDVYPHDYVIMNGKQFKPPRYYDKLFDLVDQEGAALLKLEREFLARSQEADNTPSRLRSKEKVAAAKLNLGKRPL